MVRELPHDSSLWRRLLAVGGKAGFAALPWDLLLGDLAPEVPILGIRLPCPDLGTGSRQARGFRLCELLSIWFLKFRRRRAVDSPVAGGHGLSGIGLQEAFECFLEVEGLLGRHLVGLGNRCRF
jgi:hypothetical protein